MLAWRVLETRTWLGGSSRHESLSGSSGAREKLLSIGSLFQDYSDAPSLGSGLNLSPEPWSLLQFFHEKREALLEGCLRPEFSLETEVALYKDFIS